MEVSSLVPHLSKLTGEFVSLFLHCPDLKASVQSGKTKGKAQGAPGLMPVRVLQGKLLDPSRVFMLRKVTSSDLLKVCCWKCSFTLLTSKSPLFSKLEEKFF